MAYANSQFVWITQTFCSFFETDSFRARWCFSLTPILCCWGNLVFDSDSRPNIHFLLFKTENLKKVSSSEYRIFVVECPSFDLPEEKLKYLLQIWKRRKKEGITKTANTRSAFEKSAGIKFRGLLRFWHLYWGLGRGFYPRAGGK